MSRDTVDGRAAFQMAKRAPYLRLFGCIPHRDCIQEGALHISPDSSDLRIGMLRYLRPRNERLLVIAQSTKITSSIPVLNSCGVMWTIIVLV